MFVAMVTLPTRNSLPPRLARCVSPALATISASRACWRALSTSWSTPCRLVSMLDSFSDFSMLVVPTSTGRPASDTSRISSTIASYFSSTVP